MDDQKEPKRSLCSRYRWLILIVCILLIILAIILIVIFVIHKKGESQPTVSYIANISLAADGNYNVSNGEKKMITCKFFPRYRSKVY